MPAEKVGIRQLIILSAYRKEFKTGSTGWIGKVLDPDTGKRYQVIGAVEIKERR